jgi:formiminotetrahydrofolate cyclodeaminase
MLVKLKLKEFIKELSSDSPAPGGGSAAAVSGALGAGLVSMVCRLTVGKKGYEGVQNAVQTINKESDILCTELTKLVDDDTHAFNAVMAAFRHPKKTEKDKERRKLAIQNAFKTASTVPLDVAKRCVRVLELADTLKDIGNLNTMSDIGVAAETAHAGLHGAAMNVEINLPSIKDRQYVEQCREEVQSVLEKGEKLRSSVYATVKEAIREP